MPITLIPQLKQLGKPLIGIHLDGRPISSDAADQHLIAIIEAWNQPNTEPKPSSTS